MAGLSQRALAALAGTTQSVVARIESEAVSPTWATLERLLAAAGTRVRLELESVPTLDHELLEDASRILRMTPEDRLKEVSNVSRFLAEARRV